jgi:hypothetical protein
MRAVWVQMTKKSISTFDSGTHVAFDTPGADHLLEFGTTNVVCASDLLGVGPSRLDVAEHVRARQAWFHSTETDDHLYSTEVRWETPVVLWVTSCLHDRLNLWRTCSWLRDKGISRRDILIIDLPSPPWNPDAAASRMELFECHNSVFYQSKDAIQAHLAAACSWPRERYDWAVRLWKQFVDPDPRLFAQLCPLGAPGFPELGSLWVFFSRFFPRMMSAERSLHLSRYDELLLRALSPRWRTPVKVYTSDMIQQYWEFFGCAAALSMAERLAAWAEHGAQPAVERAPGPRPDRPSLSSVYRLNKRGKQLRVELADLADAPRLPVGGAEVYAPEAPWVLRDDGRLIRL